MATEYFTTMACRGGYRRLLETAKPLQKVIQTGKNVDQNRKAHKTVKLKPHPSYH